MWSLNDKLTSHLGSVAFDSFLCLWVVFIRVLAMKFCLALCQKYIHINKIFNFYVCLYQCSIFLVLKKIAEKNW